MEKFKISNFTNDYNLNDWGVYIITHENTNIKYIGSTYCKGGFRRRWSVHLKELSKNKGNTVLRNIKNKYGIEKFKFSILERITNKIEIRKRERFWIDYYDTYYNGANCSLNTENAFDNNSRKPRKLSEEEKAKISFYSTSKKPMYLYDIYGNLLYTFQSSVECDRFLGLKKGRSSYAASQKRWLLKKFVPTRILFSDKYIPLEERKKINKLRGQKTKETHLKNGGYIVTEQMKIKSRLSNSKSIKIKLFDINNNFIKDFNSLNECDDFLKLSRGSTSKYFRGKVKALKKIYIPKII